MRDLEIRGAGNVLGAEQHGHMEAVGYDLYCKMLNQAVLALKGEETEEESYATSVECDIDAYIPAAYIKMSIRNWIFIRGSLPLRQKMNIWICRMS